MNYIVMQKNIFLLLTLLFAVSCKKEITLQSESVHAIPIDAALIIACGNVDNAVKSLNDINLFNSDQNIGKSGLLSLDSTIEQYSTYFSSKNPVYLSAHSTGAQSFDWLLITSTEKQEDKIKLLEIALQSYAETTTHPYSNSTINELSITNQPYYYTITQGLLICSQQKLLVEDAIRQLKTNNNLTQNLSFNNIYKSSNKKEDFNIYLSSKNFDKISTVLLKNQTSIYNSSEWMQWDLDLLSDGILFSGLSISHDSLSQNLTHYKSNPGHRVLTASILPHNTSYFLSRAFENYKQYKRKKEESLQKKHLLKSYLKSLSRYATEDVEVIESWIDSELSYFITEDSKDKSIGASTHIANEKEVITFLENNADSTFRYREELLFSWPSLGSLFEIQNLQSQQDTFYGACINEHLIVSEDLSLLKSLINDYKSNRTLSNTNQYRLTIDELSSRSNVFIYAQNPSLLNISDKFTTAATSEFIQQNHDLFSKFKSLGLQFIIKDNISYSNAYIALNESKTANTRAIWSQQLDNEISSNISIVKNHYTQEKEIVVQDAEGYMYLLSSSGEILWKRKFNEQIIGEVQQIDAYKNNKLQLLFNSNSKLYLVDRKGRDVGNFPINLKSNTTLPLALFDYENNRNYRILVSANNKHYMYNSKGNIVKGWKFKKSTSNAVHPAQHFVVANKDYVLLAEENGTLNVLNRRGESRLKVKGSIDFSSNPLQVVHGKNLAETRIIAIDKQGVQQNILFDGSIDNSINFEFDQGFQYKYQHRHHFFIEGSAIKVNGERLNIKYSFDSDKLSTCATQIINEQLYFAISDLENNQSYLFKESEEPLEGFPVYGSSAPKVSDVDLDGKPNLIVYGESGIIYNYTAE